jgi:hypothetical protein
MRRDIQAWDRSASLADPPRTGSWQGSRGGRDQYRADDGQVDELTHCVTPVV